jgi:N-methylhydantoinase B
MESTETLDVVTASILGAKLEATVRDMATSLMNIAPSRQLSTARAYGCAILNENAEIVATDAPLHLPTLQDTITRCLDYYQFDTAFDDVIVTNDPYSGGSSIHYLTIVAPFGYEDETVAYLAVQAHMPDIGGTVMGNYHPLAWELWQEGAVFTPLKIIIDGKRRRSAIDTLLLNGRDPEAFRGDLNAVLATVDVGRERLTSLIGEHGLELFHRGMAASIDYAQRRFEAALKRIPEGTFSGEATLDHDGQGREGLTVRVDLVRQGDRIHLDFSRTDEESRGFVNSPESNTRAFALLPLLGLLDDSVPCNVGLLRALEVTAPEGTLVSPRRPAPTGWCRDHIGYEIAEAVGQAMVAALPEEAGVAAACRSLVFTVDKQQRVGGVVEQLSRTDLGQLTQPGASATAHGNGWGAPGALGRALLPSVEEFENESPLGIRKLEYLEDSAGAGRFRGAPATETVMVVPPGGHDHLFVCMAGRTHRPPGRLGGAAPTAAAVRVAVDGTTVDVEAIDYDRDLAAGAEIQIIAAGGAGWGDPRERDPDEVRADVRDGYLTAATATATYGVEVDEQIATLASSRGGE